MLRHAIVLYVKLCHIVIRYLPLYYSMCCYAMQYHVISYNIISCRICYVTSISDRFLWDVPGQNRPLNGCSSNLFFSFHSKKMRCKRNKLRIFLMIFAVSSLGLSFDIHCTYISYL